MCERTIYLYAFFQSTNIVSLVVSPFSKKGASAIVLVAVAAGKKKENGVIARRRRASHRELARAGERSSFSFKLI